MALFTPRGHLTRILDCDSFRVIELYALLPVDKKNRHFRARSCCVVSWRPQIRDFPLQL